MKANVPIFRKLISAPILAVVLALAACASPPKPVPQPLPMPPRVVIPRPIQQTPPPADWRNAPASAGDWRWSREGSLSVARFGDTATGTRLSLTCDMNNRTVTLRRTAAAAGPVPLSITATSQRRVLSAAPTSETPSVIAVSLAASDRLLDAMAFSRGRFMVEAPGLAPLFLPSWPELSRVIEDCR